MVSGPSIDIPLNGPSVPGGRLRTEEQRHPTTACVSLLAITAILLWNRSCSRARMDVDNVIGRTLAICAHPVAAWRRVSPSGRAVIVGTYFTASYLAVLTLLLAR